MSEIGLMVAYYHRRADGSHAVLCPICGGCHVYGHAGIVNCYQTANAKFSILAPFTDWQNGVAEMAKDAAEELGI